MHRGQRSFTELQKSRKSRLTDARSMTSPMLGKAHRHGRNVGGPDQELPAEIERAPEMTVEKGNKDASGRRKEKQTYIHTYIPAGPAWLEQSSY